MYKNDLDAAYARISQLQNENYTLQQELKDTVTEKPTLLTRIIERVVTSDLFDFVATVGLVLVACTCVVLLFTAMAYCIGPYLGKDQARCEIACKRQQNSVAIEHEDTNNPEVIRCKCVTLNTADSSQYIYTSVNK